MDLYHSLVLGLLAVIAGYPLLKDQAARKSENLQTELKERREAREFDRQLRRDRQLQDELNSQESARRAREEHLLADGPCDTEENGRAYVAKYHPDLES